MRFWKSYLKKGKGKKKHPKGKGKAKETAERKGKKKREMDQFEIFLPVLSYSNHFFIRSGLFNDLK